MHVVSAMFSLAPGLDLCTKEERVCVISSNGKLPAVSQ